MLNNKKRVFVEALLLTLFVFLIGMLLGIIFEEKRVHIVEEYYVQSETSLMDILALNNFVSLNNQSCDTLTWSNIEFANRIYHEAKLIEKYEGAGRISDDMKLAHRKYDIMRTFLWINTMKTQEVCGDQGTHTVVYLYNFDSEDLTEKAVNSVWSKILTDLKNKWGDKIILIPIAVDSDMVSLNSALENFNISSYPALIVDNEHVLEELSSVEAIEENF